MSTRIPIQIVSSRLILPAIIECPSLRMRRQFMQFVIDTGSSKSYIADKTVGKSQIPIKDKPVTGQVDFGGSRFKQVDIPAINMYLLKENNKVNEHVKLSVSMKALKTTKTSERKRLIAESLPNILGMDFLRKQLLSLHVILTEDMAYLQYEG